MNPIVVLARKQLLQRLSEAILRMRRCHPVRVAIDGIDGAGKTTLADELVPCIEAHGRPVIRASTDRFHRPRAERYRRGADSPEGFYYDSFDHDRLRSFLLDPLGPGGTRRYRTAAFDCNTDSRVNEKEREAPSDAILLFDGIFAQRPELAGSWDFAIFLEVDFEEALRRSQVRDSRPEQSAADLERRFWKRYAPGQRLYLEAVKPSHRADVVVNNTHPAKPIIYGPVN